MRYSTNPTLIFIWVTVLCPTATFAQIEVIEVSGTRRANLEVIELKKVSTNIVDGFSADDIGNFPDINIADSFRRIPGTNALFDSDEGRFVTVRGVNPNLNFVTIDGMALASDDFERRTNLEAIPASAVKRLEVYKSQSADLDGNSIGANLNMVSKSAYDYPNLFMTTDIWLVQHELDDVPDNDDGPGGSLGGVFANTFGEYDQFGLLVSVDYNQKNRDERKTSNDTYRYDNPLNTAVNRRLRTLQYTNVWQRFGGSVKLEYKPDDNFHLYINSFYYTQEENEHRNFVTLQMNQLDNDSLTKHTGQVLNARNIQRYSYRPTERDNGSTHLQASYNINDHQTASFDAAFSKASYSRLYDDLRFSTEATDQLSYQYDMTGRFTTIALDNQAYITNAQNYSFSQLADQQEDQSMRVFEVKSDYAFNASQLAQGWGAKLGIKYRKTDTKYSWNSNKYTLADGQEPLLLSDFHTSNDYQPDHYSYPIFIIDAQAFNQYRQNNGDNFTLTADSTTNSFKDDYTAVEKVHAAYMMATYASDALWAGFGLRVEKTEIATLGSQNNNNNWQSKRNAGAYNNLMPSINLSYLVTNNVKLRGAISRSIGRANPSSIRTHDSVRVQDNGDIMISRGNPNLKPRQSTNLDLSVEYYNDEGTTLLSAAVFKKNIKNLIYHNTVETFDDNNVMTRISQLNNANNSKINGLELNAIFNSLGFIHPQLNNFGLSANTTLIDAGMSYVDANNDSNLVKVDHLQEQPNFIANLAMFYAWDKGEVRLAYNYTDAYSDDLRTGSADRILSERFWQAYGQTDLQAHYAFNEQLTLQFKVRNLTNKHRTRMTGLNQSLFSENVVFGRSWWIGASFSY
ncbi:MAG: TonB-dependent receptor [Algicola sp.]|nr:TonB-dependent receptor [Algicola sp.]